MQDASPTYLVVLRDLQTDDIVHCDPTKYLANALQKVWLHLVTNQAEWPIKPEVTLDEDGELQGISFVDGSRLVHASIGVYYLDREEPEPDYPELTAMEHLPRRKLESALARFFAG